MLSIVELFDTACAVKDSASFPVASSIAVLSVGAVYATVTSLPDPITDEKVSSTVSPTNAMPVGTTGEPSTVTAKADPPIVSVNKTNFI